ncbi:MAG TPA: pyridoxamine 5'-phosphate oxidase family protein [Candidatus Dormibacteraeota bacterium]|nr:pyridoxamine 5'-phosphate oxidase family protein [Candidatus Dormibacteraeota bacterium]
MTVERRSRRFSSERLERVARRLMNASTLCSLATVSPGGRAHINHMYFAWNGRYEVIWFSDRDSIHSRNLERGPTAAITIYDSHQVNGRPDRGIQLFGTAAIAPYEEATAAYTRRFRVDPSAYTPYRFRARTVKLFDERSLAPATLVTARVTRDGLAWVKTEVWVV